MLARDSAGQATFQAIVLSVANFGEGCDNLPSIAITSPAAGAHVKGAVPFDARASDDKGVVKVQFFVDNKLVTEDASFPYKVTWASDEVDEGTYSLKATAHDTAGQTVSAQIAVTVDRTPPTVAITAPSEGALVGGPFTLSATVTDSGLASVELSAGSLAPVVLASAPYATVIDPAALPSGPLTLGAKAGDKAGNTASASRTVMLDRAPTLAIVAPAGGSTVAGKLTLVAEASDDLGLGWLQWSVNDSDLTGALLTGTSATKSATLDTTALPYGLHTIAASVTDSAGQSTTAFVSVVVDQPLAVSLAVCKAGCLPEPGAEIAGTWTLEATATDDNGAITSVAFAAGATPLGTDSAAPWAQTVDTTTLPDGLVAFTATAKSSLGIEAQASFEVVVNNCDKDHDGAKAPGCGGDDCDDSDGKRAPGATDTVGDGVDQNCDGADGVDSDGDTWASAGSGGNDCDDGDAAVHPGAPDTTANGIDNDCDGAPGIDKDGDGHATLASGGDDCDDGDPKRHGGAADTVGDGIDQDCDGTDGVDSDGDTWASQGSGGKDCDDGDPKRHPGQPDPVGDGYDANCDGIDGEDVDKDGYPSPASGGADCDDLNPTVWPGAPDPFGDLLDQNCDGVDGVDADGDGHPGGCAGLVTGGQANGSSNATAAIPTGVALESTVAISLPPGAKVKTLSGTVTFDHAYYPDVTFTLRSPEGATAVVWSTPLDGDGKKTLPFAAAPGLVGQEAGGTWTLVAWDPTPTDHGTLYGWTLALEYTLTIACDCDDDSPGRHPGLADTVGDGIDQNCDGTDGLDADGDGHASEASGGDDCNDGNAQVYAGAPDTVANGIDNDCDGVPGVDADGDGHASKASGGGDCDDEDPARHPGLVDTVGDGLDQNCDGTDGVDADGDGHASEASGGDDCKDGNPLVHPGRLDTCDDGLDNDCDGVDGVDADQDGFGSWESGCADCDDADPAAYPGAPDVYGDGADADCDGIDGTDADDDGVASDGSGGPDCDDTNALVYPGAWDVVGPQCLASGWTPSSVKLEAGTGKWPRLAIVGTTQHVAFRGPSGLQHGRRTGTGAWIFTNLGVSAGSSSLSAPALALTAAGNPVIAYEEPAPSYALRIAAWNGTSFTDAAVDTSFGAGRAPSVGVDPAGKLWVSWYDWSGYDLKVSTNTSGSWQTQAVATTGDVGSTSSLVVAPDGTVHVLFTDATQGALRHAWRTGGVWTTEIVDDAGDTGRAPSAAFAANGDLVVAYVDYTNDALRLGRRTAGAWTLSTVAEDAGDGRTSIAAAVVDGRSTLWVGYEDLGGDVRVLTDRWGTWTDAKAATGDGPSLAAGAAGGVLAFRTGSGLWVATETCAEQGAAGLDENCDGVDGVDFDGDGVASEESGGTDCNDEDAAVWPGAPDTVGDGLDQSCDGVDGIDKDQDGHASTPSGGNDCDDDDPAVKPGAPDPLGDALDQNCDGADGDDGDGDGYQDAASGGDDCDDEDPGVNPGVLDLVGDGLDLDCDGADGQDADHDGYASELSGGTDCDDTDPDVYLGAPDTVGDKLDQNCDGADGVDLDRDGFATKASGGADCNDADDAFYPGAPDFVGDGFDQDCDGADGVDVDKDGHATEASGGDDCNDADPLVYLGAPDPHGDGVDQSCDGADGIDNDKDGYGGNCVGSGSATGTLTGSNGTDYAITDYTTTTSTITLGTAPVGAKVTYVQGSATLTHSHWGDLRISICAPTGTCQTFWNQASKSGQATVPFAVDATFDGLSPSGSWALKVEDLAGGDKGTLLDWTLSVSHQSAAGFNPTCDCDDTNAAKNPGTPDPYGDGVDTDCDGVDGTDHDQDGHRTPETGGDDCDDADKDNHPGNVDTCANGRDNDCDGVPGVDADKDGFGSKASGCTDCNDGNPQVYPGAPDTASNGIDNDCDGVPGVDADKDGVASIASGGTDCDDADPARAPGKPDPCGDGKETNCDGVDGVDGDKDGVAACIAVNNCTAACADCRDNDPSVYPGQVDMVGNDKDDNCDGIDGTDDDQDGVASVASGGTDCDDTDPDVKPGATDFVTGTCTAGEVSKVTMGAGSAGGAVPGRFASLAIDGAGVAHAAWYEETQMNLVYAKESGGAFFPANVDFTGDVGRHASLALAPDGTPRIAYQDTTNGTVKLATPSGATWATEALPNGASPAGAGIDLAVGVGGVPHVVYGDAANNRVAWATKAGGSWTIETVATGATTHVAIALASGSPRVLWHEAATGTVRLATRAAPGTWTKQDVLTVGAYGTNGRGVDLAIDGAGSLHVALRSTTGNAALYGRSTGGAWLWKTLSATGTPGTSVGLAVNGAGRVAVAWADDGVDRLMLGTNAFTAGVANFQVWELDRVGVQDSNDRVFSPSPAFAGEGQVRVAYQLFDYPVALGARLATLGCTLDAAAVPDANCDAIDGTDADGDGHASYGSGGADCDDGDAGVVPVGGVCVLGGEDADGDGWTAAEYGGGDCDDGDPTVNPGATDAFGDGIDKNCDGVDGAPCKAAMDCDDANPCTDDSCNVATATCVFTANTKACDDGNACTTGDVCTAKTCAGAPKSCDDGDSCTADACTAATGACTHTAIAGCTKDMVDVPAGSFWMGCNAVVDSECYSNEMPQHSVTLSAYQIDKTEVTVAAWGEEGGGQVYSYLIYSTARHVPGRACSTRARGTEPSTGHRTLPGPRGLASPTPWSRCPDPVVPLP